MSGLRESHTHHLVVLGVALAMLLVPAQVAMATHNSFGVRGEFTQADEVDPETGELVPDVPYEGKTDRIMNRYYAGFAEDNNVSVREGPLDQAGQHYEDCRPYSAFSEDEDGTQEDHYQDALPGYDHENSAIDEPNDACYVGFFDSQAEYVLALFWMRPGEDSCLNTISTDQRVCDKSSDPLYRFNPCDSSETDGCEEDDENCDRGNVDHIQSDNCKDPSHTAWWPGEFGMMAIDVDFVEAPFGGNNNDRACGGGPSCNTPTDASDAFKGEGDEGAEGSGTLTVPLEYTEQVFMFGYPHPDNTDDVSPFTVESEIFSQPLSGVTDAACGDRVPDGKCHLLTPTDIALYDTNWPHGPDERGRLCSFDPDASILNPGEGETVKPCGPLGTQTIQFEGGPAGGFGVLPVDTFQPTLPGYSSGIMTLTGTVQQFGPLEHTEFFDPTIHDDQDSGGGASNFARGIFALNPVVPQADHDLWCVQPQILADGDSIEADIDDDGTLETVTADGLYGAYQAHAIDLDVYAHGLNEFVEAVHDGDQTPAPGYHEVADPVTDPVMSLVDDAFGTAGDALDQAGDAVDEIGDQVPEELPGQEVVDEAVDTANEASRTVADANDRIGPTEGSDGEPMSGIGGYESFDRSVGTPGGFTIACNDAGNLELFGGEETTLGGLVYDSQVSRETVWLKDPTLLNGTLPAQANDTTDGTWQPDAYTFGGPFLSFFDKGGEEGAFDGCDPDDQQADPSLDDCPWFALWDAYNDGCTGSGGTCGEILESRGFDVNGEDDTYGVGLVSTLTISGPALLANEADNAENTVDTLQLVNQDPGESTCVIMLSQGFGPALATHIGDADEDFGADEHAVLCPGDDDPVVFEDAFQEQRAGSGQAGGGGGFTSTVSWVRLAPMADDVRETVDAEDDELCITSVFSTKDEVLGNGGTAETTSSIQLGDEFTETYYRDCDVLTSQYTDAGPGPDDGTPEDATYHDASSIWG